MDVDAGNESGLKRITGRNSSPDVPIGSSQYVTHDLLCVYRGHHTQRPILAPRSTRDLFWNRLIYRR